MGPGERILAEGLGKSLVLRMFSSWWELELFCFDVTIVVSFGSKVTVPRMCPRFCFGSNRRAKSRSRCDSQELSGQRSSMEVEGLYSAWLQKGVVA